VIPGDERFISTFVDGNGVAHAYCDRQTGLVWEQSPSTARFTWSQARRHCADRTVGGTGQKGWRLMSMPELASLVDTTSTLCTGGGVLCLPDGNPFSNVRGTVYWSATTDADTSTVAWGVLFSNGNLVNFSKDETILDFRAWCGRGAMDSEAY
jgi:hypothetical protein